MPRPTLPPQRRLKPQKSKQRTSEKPAKNVENRKLSYQTLETRCVLSADGLGIMIGDGDMQEAFPEQTSFTSSEDFGLEPLTLQSEQSAASLINSIQLKVNNEIVDVTENWDTVEFQPGDEIQVVGINYTYDGAEPDGVFAAETYINKLPDFTNASLVDYNDGRFSSPADDVPSTAGQANHNGVEGTWVLEEGWDRLTVNLMHYTESGATVADRFMVQLEVGNPDFHFDMDVINKIQAMDIEAGDKVQIPVSWSNSGGGKFHNYAEVDVFQGDKSGPVVWAGAVVGNSDDTNSVTGVATNTRGDFSEFWTPTEPGTYTLLYTVDPEHVWSESAEANNEFEIVIQVKPSNTAPVAVNDTAATQEAPITIDVTENDYDPEGDELQVHEYTDGQYGTVTENEDGSLTYTPHDDFVGEDQFEYTVTDGDNVSNTAVVNVTVESTGDLQVEDAHGNEDEWISLDIQVDSTKIDHVILHNIPEGAELSHGSKTQGQFRVDAEDLGGLQIKHTANSDVDFRLTVEAIAHEGYSLSLAQLNVTVDPVYDGGQFEIRDFGIEAGRSGRFPHQFEMFDDDGSEIATVRIKSIPDFINLSSGYRDGDDWVLSGSEMTKDLKLIAGYAQDTSGWQSYGRKYVYKKFTMTATVNAWEQDGGEGGEGSLDFDMHFFQRV